MKKLALATAVGMALSISVIAEDLTSNEQFMNYGVGHNIGSQILGDGTFELDVDAFIAGLKDGIAGTPMVISEDQIQAAFAEIQAKQQVKQQAALAEAQAKATTFLSDNKAKKGVVVTDSGLQYRVIESGNSDSQPKVTDTVTTHYHGMLIDGTVFDSSVERGEPIQFPVSGVIPGWTEALQLMSIGDKWELVIPPALAYGANPPGSIPANAVLIFEVELLEINSPG